MRYSKEFIRQLHQSLPEEIQDVVAAPETLDLSGDIAAEFSLTMQQENSLAYEITMLLLGLTKADDFVSILTRELKTIPEISAKIATAIQDKLLSKIPEDVLSAHEEYAQSKLKEAGQGAYATSTTSTTSEIAPENLPETIPGQVAHDVPHIEAPAPVPVTYPAPATPTVASTPASAVKSAPSSDISVTAPTAPSAPKSIVEEKLSQVTVAEAPKAPEAPKIPSYAPGKDPYREPLE